MLMKICPHCGRHIQAGTKCICNKQRVRDTRKRYDTSSRNDTSRKLYHSKAWKSVRLSVKARASGLDEVAMKQGIIKQGTTAHHIIPIEDRPELALNISNLIWISSHTHKNIHRAYRKSPAEKKKVQQRLQSIIASKL